MINDENLQNGWIKVFHPSGAQVTVPLDLRQVTTLESANLLIQSVDNILAAGFQVNAPGLEEGELMEEISHIARREGADQTAIIDFYSSNTKLEKKFMHVYLNTADDVTAFESATGILLDTINVYDGQQAIERTSPKASKYVLALPRSIKAVYKINPKWEQWKQAGGEGKEPHKRLLARYEVSRKPESNDTPKIDEPVTNEGGAIQYKKLSGDLVQALIKKTGFKAVEITPILTKITTDTISFESALKLINTNLNKESV